MTLKITELGNQYVYYVTSLVICRVMFSAVIDVFECIAIKGPL